MLESLDGEGRWKDLVDLGRKELICNTGYQQS